MFYNDEDIWKWLLGIAFLLVLLIFMNGCSYCTTCLSGTFPVEPEIEEPIASPPPSEPNTPAVSRRTDPVPVETIYFAFDMSVLNQRAKESLLHNFELLRGNDIHLTIEGHTCSIGDGQYNLALGERRARAAWQYLIDLGISRQRLRFTTYGEERPISGVLFENRRVEFVIEE